MPQDFAKRHKKPAKAQQAMPRWTWFVTGFTSGAFVTFLGLLWYLQEPAAPAETDPVAAPSQARVEEDDWSFYEIFRRTEVPIVNEYESAPDTVATGDHAWILQAGSFRRQDDADQLRGELILMGFDAGIQKSKVEGESWYRVLIGPLETESDKNSAQNKLAEEGIQFIAFKAEQ
ncbi:MAG: SPOR domain-containing protein [Pseudomonadales bacterium]